MDYEPGEARADYEHIQADLHELMKLAVEQRDRLDEAIGGLLNPIYGQLSEIRADISAIYGQLSELARLRSAVDELLPAARRAAAMLDTPVTAYLAARREASNGERVQRAAEAKPRLRRPRAARRELPDA